MHCYTFQISIYMCMHTHTYMYTIKKKKCNMNKRSSFCHKQIHTHTYTILHKIATRTNALPSVTHIHTIMSPQLKVPHGQPTMCLVKNKHKQKTMAKVSPACCLRKICLLNKLIHNQQLRLQPHADGTPLLLSQILYKKEKSFVTKC